MKNFVISAILAIVLMTAPTKALADCYTQCPVNQGNAWDYINGDHFQWTNYDDDVHLLIGFGGSMVIGEALVHYAKLPSWQAALIGSVVMGMIGTTKEVMFDTYTSRTDIKTWWAGGAAGGLTVIALHF